MAPAVATRMRVYDTLSRRLVPLPLATENGRPLLRLYVCGVTPYESGHMGHAFTFCAFDILVRHLEATGVRVRYVQNVTDVDDPLFERARRDGVDWKDLAEREEAALVRDMARLGWRPPDLMPRVSEEIPGILAAAEALAAKGYAYPAADGTLYFEASRYAGFGQLSQRSRRSMLAKLRDEELLGVKGPGAKRDWLDFPLWRPSAPDEPAWASAYGAGRPGWHIECSAMAMRHLGEQVEIHGGGRDLTFSHHESERAQSESLTGCAPFARAWLHAGLVRYQGRKMSKSLGNLVNIGQALERASPAGLRVYLASHHYRRDWSFTWAGLEAAERLVRRVASLAVDAQPARELAAAFDAALDADLDTPEALRVLRRAVAMKDGSAARRMLDVLAGSASLDR
jgi:L-cysteine:1D-myo-inositol 2-amino-2-deoxy-alpha-D-glucopyranoside ligase